MCPKHRRTDRSEDGRAALNRRTLLGLGLAELATGAIAPSPVAGQTPVPDETVYENLINVQDYPSLQAAYDDLPPEGGMLFLPDGRYDVGDGFVLNREKPCWCIGPFMRRYGPGSNIPAGYGPTLYSSTGAPSLVIFTEPGDPFINGYWFHFIRLNFEMTAPTTFHAVNGQVSTSMVQFDTCQFWFGPDAPVDNVAIYAQAYFHTNDSDASWWHVRNCTVRAGALFQSGSPDIGQAAANRHIIENNICFGLGKDVPDAKPCVAFYFNNAARSLNNNIEKYHIGARFHECYGCWESGDAGEQVECFIDLYKCYGSCFAPMGESTAYTMTTMYRIESSIENVLVFAPATYMRNLYENVATAIVQVDGALNDNLILAPKDVYQKHVHVSGTLNHAGAEVGFFGAEPVAQPAPVPDTSGVTLAELEAEVNQLKAALRSLGLIANQDA